MLSKFVYIKIPVPVIKNKFLSFEAKYALGPVKIKFGFVNIFNALSYFMLCIFIFLPFLKINTSVSLIKNEFIFVKKSLIAFFCC